MDEAESATAPGMTGGFDNAAVLIGDGMDQDMDFDGGGMGHGPTSESLWR